MSGALGGRQRLLDLLADQAMQGLDSEDQAELTNLFEDFPDVDRDALDHTAAAIHLALAPPHEAMPAALRVRIESQARGRLGDPERGAEVTDLSRALRREAPVWREAVAWVAAAASIALLLYSQPPPPDVPLSPAARREKLLATAPDAITLAWTATEDPAGAAASGDVVWSGEHQAGFLRFQGLAVNDPGESQYQLWIFDATRDDAHPVDGGVFDVDRETGDVIVQIHPKLRVVEPTLFAITVEKPGGVVVSSRERLPLLAKVDG